MNSVASIIRQEIERVGPISFSRFMELALYAPGIGYYERQKEIGRRGDFYTSVSVGSLFGELLAFQFAQWLSESLKVETPRLNPSRASPLPSGKGKEQNSVQILEAGAHNGQLAADILTALQKSEVFDRLEYWILEPSLRHQEWQRQTLEKFSGKVRWFDSWSSLPTPVSGVVFSNELLDAMPVDRWQWIAGEKCWLEMKVIWEDEKFAWRRDINPRKELGVTASSGLDVVLPGGFIAEVSPAASAWWQEASSHLQAGKLMAIDYGLMSELEFLYPQRSQGTLRGYGQHRLIDDVLLYPGEIDLTAHVNFSELRRVGEIVGLKTEAFISQAKFLTQTVEQVWKTPEEIKRWTPQKNRQLQTLIHPEHLGRAFQVLIQSK